MKYDVIIVGAGAAGLIAMKELLASGYKVCLLEAAPVAGGRILTMQEPGFGEPVETGAEFIHSNLPLTIELLQAAKIPYIAVEGDLITVQNGEVKKEDNPDGYWEEFMSKLKKQESDLTIEDFLAENFSAPKYAELRNTVQRFAEGFDLADITIASLLSVRKEWKDFDDQQYRVGGGYIRMIEYLQNSCWLPDSIIHFNALVNLIEYGNGSATVHTATGEKFKASKVIVTVSLGMLQSGTIRFDPPLIAHDTAIQQLAYGSVIKFLLEFDHPFWQNFGEKTGFILSDQVIPTWWTQFPAETNLLTGWLGGPPALMRSTEPDENLLQSAIDSLSGIFKMPENVIKKHLVHHKIVSWHSHPYAKGGYSFNTLQSERAKKILEGSVYETIWFAGEAMYNGEFPGTVEAALQSGRDIAKKIVEINR